MRHYCGRGPTWRRRHGKKLAGIYKMIVATCKDCAQLLLLFDNVLQMLKLPDKALVCYEGRRLLDSPSEANSKGLM